MRCYDASQLFLYLFMFIVNLLNYYKHLHIIFEVNAALNQLLLFMHVLCFKNKQVSILRQILMFAILNTISNWSNN